LNARHQIIQQSISQQLLTAWLFASLISGCTALSVNQDGAPDQTLDWNSIPDPAPKIEPLSKSGNPSSYVVNGQRYLVNTDTENFSQTGIASWYGTKFHGRLTSSGEPYDMYQMTAAHKSLPLPSYVSVKNLENNKQIVVKVNDRGPFVDGRIIDLSYTAAHKLEIVKNGTARVEIGILASPKISSKEINDDSHIAFAKNNSQQYFVQLGAFSERINAENFREQLTSHSIEPTLIKSSFNTDGDLHKVQVGPLSNARDLEVMESRLSDLGYTQVYIVIE